MWHHCAARQQPVDCSRKHYISQQRPLVNYVLAVVAQRRLVGRIAAAASKITVPTTAAPSRILFIGGLPAKTAAGELEQQLLSVCESVGCQPTRVKVMTFESEAQRSRFAHGWLHKGFGLLAFQDESCVRTAAAAIRTQVPEWGAGATMGSANKAPEDWPAQLTYSAEELAALEQQQAALRDRREHNRRQRRRQSQRLVDSVDQLLSGLQQPFGQAAQQLYQPLLTRQACQQLLQHVVEQPAAAAEAAAAAGAESSSVAQLPRRLGQALRWPVLQQQLRQQLDHQQPRPAAGPIQLAAAAAPVADIEARLLLDWSQVPLLLDPAFGGRLADADVVRAGKGRMNTRALRKRVQVESFALLLWQLTAQAGQLSSYPSNSSSTTSTKSLHVVEFGSGSGNLVLPLAHLFPHFSFHAIDMKPSAVALLQERVDKAELDNVTVQLGHIENFTGPADVVLALHACGSATDWALLQAAARGAAFIVSPCCIGKINRHSSDSRSGIDSEDDTPQHKHQHQHQQQQRNSMRFPDANKGLQYPRSQQLHQQMAKLVVQVQQELQQQGQRPEQAAQQPLQPGADTVVNRLQEMVVNNSDSLQEQCQGLFSILAATADYSHQHDHSHPELAGLAKTNVELDRGMYMQESGYQVALVRLLQPELTAKSDVLVGIQADYAGAIDWRLKPNGSS